MRYLVLLNNPYVYDTRVERLIQFLSRKKNNEILLLCTYQKGLRKIETHKNVKIIRIPYSNAISLLTSKWNFTKALTINTGTKKSNKKFMSHFSEIGILFKQIIKIIVFPLEIITFFINEITTLLENYLLIIPKAFYENYKAFKVDKKLTSLKKNYKKFHIITYYFLTVPFKNFFWMVELIAYILILPIKIFADILSIFLNKSIDLILDNLIFKQLNTIISKTSFLIKLKAAFYELEIYSALFSEQGIKFNPDFIHANDLATLGAGYHIKNITNAKLVYDSHELEMDKNKNFSKVVKIKRKNSEKKLIKETDKVITVSESIADFLKNTYKINKPIVIYNSPKFIESKKIKRKFDLRKYLKIPKNSKIIVYVGLISINRGIENAIQSMKYFDKNTYFLLVGPVNPTFNKIYLQDYFTFKKDSDAFTKNNNLILHTQVKHDILNLILKQCDVSLLPIQNVCKSYDFCFPNKLLESVFSAIPLSASSLTELSKFIKKYKAGELFNEKDPKDIYLKTLKVLNNPERYIVSRKKLDEIKSIYSYESQLVKLKEIYG